MELGFITLNNEERSKVNRVLQAIREQQAIDELGIGRLRDAFSNTMFPGMSTLQHHAKYFAVLPSLYYEAEKGSYAKVSDVRRRIIELEIKLTRQLMNGVGPGESGNGITGSDVLAAAERDYTKYVKYDPTYIYWNGMVTYDIVKAQGSIYQLILERSKGHGPEREDDDSDDLSGKDQLFSTSGESYDFDNGDKLSLKLTPKEARFILDKMTGAKGSKDSMLAFMLKENLNVCEDFDSLEGLLGSALPERFREVYRLSVVFSHFVKVLRIRTQFLFSRLENQTEMIPEYEQMWSEYLALYKSEICSSNIDAILAYFAGRVTEPTLIAFCHEASRLIDKEDYEALDSLLIKREKQVKGAQRSKLHNHSKYPDYRFSTSGLTYRWELVYIMIKEIREGLGIWQES